ncbi:MAG TPA: hypothetical protein VD886_17670 [Herpetosiphonaceae bacterium]|nr:hypothetical protein [Herpetosiphonaceae bacterium]
MNKPRFDRILPLISLVILGLMVVFLLESSPDNPLVARISDDFPVISVAWIIIALLVIIISTGADLLARAHPELEHSSLLRLPGPLRRFEVTPVFWVLPSAAVVSSFAFFRLFRATLEGTAFILVLLACGILLTVTLVAQHYALDRDPAIRDKARTATQAVAYLVGFGLFSAIAYAHYRVIFTGGLMFAASVPLAYRLLTKKVNEYRRPLVIAVLVVGVVMAEASAILNYWPAPFLINGTVLLGLFYIFVNLLQHSQNGTLDRRIVWELSLLGVLIFGVLAGSTIW